MGNFDTTPVGLSTQDAQILLQKYGRNEITVRTRSTLVRVFLSQFRNPLVFVLLVVSAVTWYMGELTDTAVILAVVAFNSVIGTIQETKANNTIESLRSLLSPQAKVYRDGQLQTLPAAELVPGDSIALEPGDRVPADATLLTSTNLHLDESQLTGESYPIGKNPSESPQVFMGTVVTSGRAIANITQTGEHTELGKISQTVAEHITQATPLEIKFRQLSRLILVVVSLVCLFVFFIGVSQRIPWEEMLTVGVSLGVSAIPEGLPIVVTITLSIGVFRMSQKKAIVRNLPSVSTLSGVDVICTDKTGTITEGRVQLAQMWTYQKGQLQEGPDKTAIALTTLCNDAEVGANAVGDLLDLALLSYAKKHQISAAQIRKTFRRIDEIPFDSKYKYQATLHRSQPQNLIVAKGAFEALAPLCHFSTQKSRQEFEEKSLELASQGFKVLILASQATNAKELGKKLSEKLHVIGLIAFFDPLRKDVHSAVRACQNAGVRVIMITGDHLETAKTIAQQAGIYHEGDLAVDSRQFQKSLAQLVNEEQLRVIARATPLDKSTLIELLKKKNHVVAMTGDGVNDAPALVQADIGIAMGKIGTDAAREASDMVLLDDKFSTIVNGIFEARGVFENIRKVVSYLFTASYGEIFVILVGLMIMSPLPLTAVQILWLNLVTDALLDVSLATESNSTQIMRQPNQRYRQEVVDHLVLLRVVLLGTVMGVGSLWFFLHHLQISDLATARTACFLVLAMYQWYHAFNARSEDESLLSLGIFSNHFLLLSLFIVTLFTALAIYNPALQMFLGTVSVGPEVWVQAALVSIPIILIEEGRKWISRTIQLRAAAKNI